MEEPSGDLHLGIIHCLRQNVSRGWQRGSSFVKQVGGECRNPGDQRIDEKLKSDVVKVIYVLVEEFCP